jgi:hypothetical protein
MTLAEKQIRIAAAVLLKCTPQYRSGQISL